MSLPQRAIKDSKTTRHQDQGAFHLPNYTDAPEFVSRLLAGVEEPDRVDSPGDPLELILDIEPDDPGSFHYSNTKNLLIGQVIEAVDGGDIDQSLQRPIAEPLGLTKTRYTFISSRVRAAGALISTADDLLRFVDGPASGQLVSDASFARMADFSNAPYGFGLLPVSLETGSRGFGHNGSIPGYYATMGFSPSDDSAIIVLTNNETIVADRLAQQILRRE